MDHALTLLQGFFLGMVFAASAILFVGHILEIREMKRNRNKQKGAANEADK